MQTKTDWHYHTEQQKISGFTKAEYCRRNGLNKFTFYEKSRKSNPAGKLVELPFLANLAELNQTPAFEFHFQIPFSFRFRLNIKAGGEK